VIRFTQPLRPDWLQLESAVSTESSGMLWTRIGRQGFLLISSNEVRGEAWGGGSRRERFTRSRLLWEERLCAYLGVLARTVLE
jgi:hypothetical protein